MNVLSLVNDNHGAEQVFQGAKGMEVQLVEEAVARFRQESGLAVNIEHFNDGDSFGVLRVAGVDDDLVFVVKTRPNSHSLGALIDQIKGVSRPGAGLLISDYLTPGMAKTLKASGTQYLDAAGNAFLNADSCFVWVDGRKPRAKPASQVALGRAFSPAGLKVVYACLKDEFLVNASYRVIADRAYVALGSVGLVIKDLVRHGFVQELDNGDRRITRRHDLLGKWMENYPHRLRRQGYLGRFTADSHYWWQHVDPLQYGAFWGGEVAAAAYTNYINPKDALMYISEDSLSRLLKDARLRKPQPLEDVSSTVEFYLPFTDQMGGEQGLADPLLVVADLLATGDPRNIEVAQKLREKYTC